MQKKTCLDCNNVIHKYQYRFRKNLSTENADLHIVEYQNNEVNRNRNPINLHLDLSKAFDCFSHDKLLLKLQHYGI